jgi:hypothetical protein
LREIARLKRVINAKCCAVKNWFRSEKKTEFQEKYEEEETKKVSVVVCLEDPGAHTHRSSGHYQMEFDTETKRPKYTFWKKLVRVFILKGLYWEWQHQTIDTDIKRWATLEELSQPKENEIYRVKVLGKRNKHANRPGKGRRAQRKFKNFQGTWRPSAEHNVNVGTVTNDLCQAERNQRLTRRPEMRMPDTSPRITIERRTKDPIIISRDDEPPRPPDWIPLDLKPDVIRLSEQGERKLADARMDDWAQDRVEYEERQRTEIEQKKIAFEKEQESRALKRREEEEEQARRLSPEAIKRHWEQTLSEEET